MVEAAEVHDIRSGSEHPSPGSPPKADPRRRDSGRSPRLKRRGRWLVWLLLLGGLVAGGVYVIRGNHAPQVTATFGETGLLEKAKALIEGFLPGHRAAPEPAVAAREAPSLVQPSQEAPLDITDQLLNEPTIEERVATASAAIQAALEPRIEALAGELQALQTDFAAFKGSLEADQSSLVAGLDAVKAEHGATLADFEERLSGLASGLGGAGAPMSDMLARYDAKFSQLAADMGQADEPLPASETLPVESLPFKVMSIDLWGDRPQLAVVRDGQTVFLNAGDTSRGWSVASIDRASGAIALRGPDGKTMHYRLDDQGMVTVASTPSSLGRSQDRIPGQLASTLPTLSVSATPAGARVRVMNIVPVYRDQMPLRPGPYEIMVDAPGYQPFRSWFRLGATDRVIPINLERLQ